jgi:hypothetical protein
VVVALLGYCHPRGEGRMSWNATPPKTGRKAKWTFNKVPVGSGRGVSGNEASSLDTAKKKRVIKRCVGNLPREPEQIFMTLKTTRRQTSGRP